jgi:hypothetical protein
MAGGHKAHISLNAILAMTRTIEFTVDGALPPKKDGANSMWGKSSERVRLVKLRRAALLSRGDAAPLTQNIRLLVEIRCPSREVLRAGDLDNFHYWHLRWTNGCGEREAI